MTQQIKSISHRVIALVSGGKDSCYSMLQCVAAGHEIVGLANLRPTNNDENELDSYMYQTVGHQAIDLYSEAMELPLYRGNLRKGGSLNTNSVYTVTENDEVEDLYNLLRDIQRQKGEAFFTAVCSGAILSDYQRVRVESVCSRLGLISLSYLWRRNQAKLFDEMIDDGKLNSIIVKVATLGLDQSHLGRSLKEVRPHLHAMHGKYGINICGEGGEYETFTLDCPLFVKSIVVEDSSVFIHSPDAFAPVALFILKSLRLEDKPQLSSKVFSSHREMLKYQNVQIKTPLDYSCDEIFDASHVSSIDRVITAPERNVSLAPILKSVTCDDKDIINQIIEAFGDVRKKSGWFAISNLTSCQVNASEATRNILECLKLILTSIGASLIDDLVSVVVLVRDMSQYLDINKEYIRHFGLNPPVRVCVQCDIDVPLTLSVIGYKRHKLINEDSYLDGERQVMHVQSISHWAAANIGPYSQAVEVDGVLYIAGLIGLISGGMELISGLKNQSQLSLRHLERILDARGGKSLANIAEVVCYVTDQSHITDVKDIWIKRVEKCFQAHNCDLFVKASDNQDISLAHYLQGILQIVVVPRLPKNALVEWQVVAIDKPIVKIYTEEEKHGEKLMLSIDEKSHVFFVGSTHQPNWEEKWEKERLAVDHFLAQNLDSINIPKEGHMKVFGQRFFVDSDNRNNFGRLSLPCRETQIDILPNLIPVKYFSNDEISYAFSGILY